MTAARYVAALLLLFPVTLHGQRGGQVISRAGVSTPIEIRPRSCALADTLAGRALERPKYSAMAWRAGTRNHYASSSPFRVSAARPLKGLMLTATSVDSGPDPAATFGFQILMEDSVLRSGEGARLVLRVDDDGEYDLGAMSVTENPGSRARRIDQTMIVGLPDRVARHLVRGGRVTGTIGGTPFVIPDRTRELFRAVFIAATCGTDIW